MFQPPPGNPRFPLFDALRGGAALSIFLLHAVLASGADSTWYGRYAMSLEAGVAVFFVISGFLLYRPWASARIDAAPSAPRLADYARNRVLRIVPAYWVALTALAVAIGLGGFWTDHSWSYYLFVQELDLDWSRGGIIPTWSLTVEASFYALLPLIALAMRTALPGGSRRRRVLSELAMVAVLAAVGLAYRILLRGDIGDDPTSNLWALLPATLDWFALGMGLAVASVALAGRRPAPIRLVERAPGLCWLAAGLLFVASALMRPGGGFPATTTSTEWLGIHLAYGLLAVALALPAVFGDGHRGLPRRLLATRTLGWLGLVSYGLFLYHQPIAYEVADLELGGLWADHTLIGVTLVAGAISIACAAASYYLVERPALRLKRTRANMAGPRPERSRRTA